MPARGTARLRHRLMFRRGIMMVWYQ